MPRPARRIHALLPWQPADRDGEAPPGKGLLTLAGAAALGAGIYVLREALANPNEGVTLLYVIPISLVAIRFGALGGIAAALVAVALFGVWERANTDVTIGPLGYTTRTIAFLVLGGLVGGFAQERQRLVTQLREMAETDQLTGLLNHASFYDKLAYELALARRYGRHGAVMVADLDGFKEINDRFGHTVGDQVLKDVARCLRQSVRETDMVGRVGGDEFAALLPATTRDGAEAVALKVARLLEQMEHEVGGERLNVGLSVGVTSFEGIDLSPESVHAAADRAMYDAKRNRQVASTGHSA